MRQIVSVRKSYLQTWPDLEEHYLDLMVEVIVLTNYGCDQKSIRNVLRALMVEKRAQEQALVPVRPQIILPPDFKSRYVTLGHDERRRGIHLVGASGSAKSRLLGRGLAVWDLYSGVPMLVCTARRNCSR